MIVYFADRYMNILGLASTELPGEYGIKNDRREQDIDSGVATFEFYLQYHDQVAANELAKAGNYLLRADDGQEFYTILECEDNAANGEIYIYAEDAGLDLLNEICGAYEAPQAYPIATYVNKFAADSGFEIGINEIATLSRKLSWEGEATAAERIRSVATQFGAEIGYSFDIDKLVVKHKYINIYAKRGKEVEQELRFGRDISNIIKKTSIANLCTALTVTGGTPEGSETPITLKGYAYDDGDIYVDSGGMLKSRSALSEWSRYLSESSSGEGHIFGSYSYDTTSQQELCSHAVTELKKRSQPEITYDVEIVTLPENLKIGDTINIVNDKGELYLSARLLKLEVRRTEGIITATLGDFIIKSSGISAQLAELAEEFEKWAQEHMPKPITIVSDVIEYAIGESATVAPTSGWSTTVVEVPAGKFLWSRTIITYSDETVTTTYAVAKQGQDGQQGGKGDKGDKGDPGDPGADGEVYVPMEYIESPPEKNARISTGYSVTSRNITLEAAIMRLDTATGESDWMGNYQGNFLVGHPSQANTNIGMLARPGGWWAPTTMDLNEKHTVVQKYLGDTGRTLIVDGFEYNNATIDNSGITLNSTNTSIGLFAGSGTTHYCNFYGRMYYAKIYDNDVLVRDFIPVQRVSDQEYGMYDRITGEFYGSVSAGKFTGSPIVSADELAVDVGGRNMLSDTQAFGIKDTTGWYLADGSTNAVLTSDTFNGCVVRSYPSTTLSSGNKTIVYYMMPAALTAQKMTFGKTYIFSFWAKGTGSFRTYLYGSSGYTQVDHWVASDGTTGTTTDGAKLWTATSEWQRFWIAYTLKATGTAETSRFLVIRHDYNASATLQLNVAGCKFEEGNTVTDWTPAPEDAAAYVDSREIGGTNLLSYTGNYKDWYLASRWSKSGNVLTFAAGELVWQDADSPAIPWSEVNGNTFTLSFDYRAEDYASSSGTYIIGFAAEKKTAGPAATSFSTRTREKICAALYKADMSTEWKRAVFVLENITDDWFSNTWGDGGGDWFAFCIWSRGTCKAQIRNIKFERGNVATAWSPNPNDIDISSRNLLRATAKPIAWSGVIGVSAPQLYGNRIWSLSNTNGTLTKSDEGVLFTHANNTKNWIYIPLVYENAIEDNSHYILTFKYKSSVAISAGACYIIKRSTPNTLFGSLAFSATTEWTDFKFEFDTGSDATARTNWALALPYLNVANATFEIKDGTMMLTKGDKQGPWMPAPEDEEERESSGRNLIVGSQYPYLTTTAYTFNGFTLASGGNGTASVIDIADSPIPECSQVLRISNNTGNTNKDFSQKIPDLQEQFEAGNLGSTLWVFSGYVRAISGTVSALVRVYGSTENVARVIPNIGTDWHYIEVPLVFKNLTCTNNYLRIQFGITGPGSIEYIGVKLERGNYATPWSAAPEDYEVGGTNLLRATPKSHNAAAYNAYQLNMTENLKAGQTYTLQFWDMVVDANSSWVGTYWGAGTVRLAPPGGSNITEKNSKPDANGYYRYTFTVSDAQASGSGSANSWLNVYNGVNGHAGSNMTIGKWKLEKGNVPTEWSAAPEDVEEGIDDAKKVANNYLSSDSTGIMVADLADGAQTPSTATGRNVKIDNDSVDIRDGQTVLASFGEETVIGEEDFLNMAVGPTYITGSAPAGEVSRADLFRVDIHSGRIVATYTKQELGSTDEDWTVSLDNTPMANYPIYIEISGARWSDYFMYGTAKTIILGSTTRTISYDGNKTLTFAHGNTYSGSTIYMVYPIETSGVSIGVGTRGTDVYMGLEEGTLSATFGEALFPYYDNQLLGGKYNAPSNVPFAIGNGSISQRSNAFEVDWDGNATVYGDLISNNIGVLAGSRENNIATKSIPNTTDTILGSFTLPSKGTWLVHVLVRFSTNTTGRRYAKIVSSNSASAAAIGNLYEGFSQAQNYYTDIKMTCLFTIAAESSTNYVAVWQNSGGALNAWARWFAIRIK